MIAVFVQQMILITSKFLSQILYDIFDVVWIEVCGPDWNGLSEEKKSILSAAR